MDEAERDKKAMKDESLPIGGHRYVGQEDGVSMATHQVQVWLENDGLLCQRAKEVALGAEVNGVAGDLAGWVEGLLYGDGPESYVIADHSQVVARDAVRESFTREDFDAIDWGFVRESLLAE